MHFSSWLVRNRYIARFQLFQLWVVFLLIVFGGMEHLGFAKEWQNAKDSRKAVVRIQVLSQSPDVQNPWRMLAPSASIGTGFYIGKGRILTNAHVVEHARFVTIQKDGDSHVEAAVVRFVAHDSDLALLEVEKPDFFTGIDPLVFGGVPELHSPVFVVGYPIGGNEVSITEGIASRLEYQAYVHSKKPHLILQVDAAINSGNSGGPVLQGASVIGVAFEAYHGANNISYAIPTPVVERFLKDIEDGVYHGHPEDGLTLQSAILDNPSARAFYQLPAAREGVLVNHVAWYAPTFAYLQPGDLLLAVDGKKIGNDGLVLFGKERVDFRVLFDLKQIGDSLPFEVWRKGKNVQVVVPITSAKPHIPLGPRYRDEVPFVMVGGILFIELTENYLEQFGNNWAVEAPFLLRYFYAAHPFLEKTKNNQSLILVSQRLSHQVNQSWEVAGGQVVQNINGIPIKSLQDFKKALSDQESEFLVFEFFGKENPLVMNRAKVQKANPQIAKLYDIPNTAIFPQEQTAVADLLEPKILSK